MNCPYCNSKNIENTTNKTYYCNSCNKFSKNVKCILKDTKDLIKQSMDIDLYWTCKDCNEKVLKGYEHNCKKKYIIISKEQINGNEMLVIKINGKEPIYKLLNSFTNIKMEI